jgi:hypothetical protein
VTERRRPFIPALTLGAIVAVAYPFADLAWSCRFPESEACVWGKAYLPLSLVLSVALIGSIVAALTYAILVRRHR